MNWTAGGRNHKKHKKHISFLCLLCFLWPSFPSLRIRSQPLKLATTFGTKADPITHFLLLCPLGIILKSDAIESLPCDHKARAWRRPESDADDAGAFAPRPVPGGAGHRTGGPACGLGQPNSRSQAHLDSVS